MFAAVSETSIKNKKKLRVGLTEKHGMVDEYSQYPPENIEYSFLQPAKGASSILRSPIKGYFRRYESKEHDLIEATLSPIFTPNNWIYSIANFQEAMAFNFCGCPLPRSVRAAYMKHLFLKNNFRKLIFWSEAGRQTIRTYGKVSDTRVIEKSEVVYPAIRKISKNLIRYNNDNVNILFSGDFFRKGGINVIDSFEYIQNKYKNVSLIICSDENLDFNTKNIFFKKKYIEKIKQNKKINFMGRIQRDKMIYEVLPNTDIYLLPTYAEAFGYAILEAMAYGIPVISTNIFAIPEMIEHGVSGLLIDIGAYDCENMFKGYMVDHIPNGFNSYITEKLTEYLSFLIDSKNLRIKFGTAGLNVARNRFSFEVRNDLMDTIYQSVV